MCFADQRSASLAMPEGFALARVAVELKFSSHGRSRPRLRRAYGEGGISPDVLRRSALCKFGYARRLRACARGSRTEVLIPRKGRDLDFVEPTERVGLSLMCFADQRSASLAMPEGFALARVAVELKFSSHGKVATSTSSSLRRGWDSNPRWARGPQRFSRPPHSTTLPPLQHIYNTVLMPLYMPCRILYCNPIK